MLDLEKITKDQKEVKISYSPSLCVPLDEKKVDVHVYRSLPAEETQKLGLKRVEADWFVDYL